jgi:uncharacterized membrane protein
MSYWHLLWIFPCASLCGIGLMFLYCVHWFPSAERIHAYDMADIDREVSEVKARIPFVLLSVVLAVSVFASAFLQHVFYVAFFFWLPMYGASALFNFFRRTRFPQKSLMTMPLGAFIAVYILKAESWLFEPHFALEWLFGMAIGLGAVFGEYLKSRLRPSDRIPRGGYWVPFDQISSVLGGWVGLMLVQIYVLNAHFGIGDIFILLALFLIASAKDLLASLFVTSLQGKKPN